MKPYGKEWEAYRIATIEKIIKTGQIKVSQEFILLNGLLQDRNYRENHKNRLLSELRSMDLEKLTTSQLEEIKKIMSEGLR